MTLAGSAAQAAGPRRLWSRRWAAGAAQSIWGGGVGATAKWGCVRRSAAQRHGERRVSKAQRGWWRGDEGVGAAMGRWARLAKVRR